MYDDETSGTKNMAPEFTSRRIWSWTNMASFVTGIAGVIVTLMIALTSYRDQRIGQYQEMRSREMEYRLERTLRDNELARKKYDGELQAARRRIAALEGQLAVTRPGQVERPNAAVLQELGAMKGFQELLAARVAKANESAQTANDRIARLESVISQIRKRLSPFP